MNPLLEKVLDEGLTAGVSIVVGYIGAAVKLGKRFAAAEKKLHDVVAAKLDEVAKRTDATEKRLFEAFEELRAAMAGGLHMEIETIREHIRSEIGFMRERLADIKQMAEDLRNKSGDYSEEAELAAFMGKVAEWMDRTNRSVGRLEGMLGATSKAITTRPPPAPPRPAPPRPPRLPR